MNNLSEAQSVADSENVIVSQFLSLLADDDIENFDYVLKSILPQLADFWDSIAYLFFLKFFMRSSSFYDRYTSKEWFEQQIQNQLQFCDDFIIKKSRFELTWIIPIIKIIYDPTSIPGQIDYLQEFVNFLDTPIKGVPKNFGLILLEIGLEFVIRAYNVIIQRKELTEKLNSFLNWTDQLFQLGLISQDQHDYFGMYLSIWFPKVQFFTTTDDKEKYLRQNIKLCNKLETEITNLLPFEQLRIKFVYSRFLLEYFILNPDNIETAYTLRETTYKTIINTHFSTGTLLDYAFMLANRIEVIENTIDQINDVNEKENQASEAVNQTLILIQILENLPKDLTMTIGLRLIGGVSVVLGYLPEKESIQACQTLMLLSEKSINAGKKYLNEPSFSTAEFFKNLARSYLGIGIYASIESRHKTRALDNSQEYIKQSIAISDYLGSFLEAIEARTINLKINFEQIRFLIVNKFPEINYLTLIHDSFFLIREIIDQIISRKSYPLLLNPFKILLNHYKFVEEKISVEKEADLKKMLLDVKRIVKESIDIESFPELNETLKKL